MSTCLRLFCSYLLVFQTTVVSTSGAQQRVGTTGTALVLEDGTPVKVRISQTVSSADAQVNDRVEFEVLEDVKVDDVLVIPKGGIAWGTVTEAQPKRRMARGGKLEIVMDSVRLVDGQKAALRAVKEGKGGGHTEGMTIGIVSAAVLFWPAAPLFLLMHGKDITFPKGTEVPTFVNGNMRLDRAKFRQSLDVSTQPQESTSPQAMTPSASMTISSTPSGAEIYLDGSFFGNTPSTVNAPTGKHSICVKKPGYQDWVRELTVSGGAINLTAELVRGSSPTVPTAAPMKKTFTVTEVGTSSSGRGQSTKRTPNSAPVVVETPPGWIGISSKNSLMGVVVTAVTTDGPAAKAGLKVGDVINELNGTSVKDEDFEAEIDRYKSGTKVKIAYMRNAWAFETTVIVGIQP
jgi:hypothetical protein